MKSSWTPETERVDKHYDKNSFIWTYAQQDGQYKQECSTILGSILDSHNSAWWPFSMNSFLWTYPIVSKVKISCMCILPSHVIINNAPCHKWLYRLPYFQYYYFHFFYFYFIFVLVFFKSLLIFLSFYMPLILYVISIIRNISQCQILYCQLLKEIKNFNYKKNDYNN